MKFQSLRPEVDHLTGALTLDERFMGASEADLAALEWGLRLADAWTAEVTVACAGHAAADPVLNVALAAGATRAVRCSLPDEAPSAAVARALAHAFDGFDVVVCGDHSLDRGSGAVPALLAAELDAAQALGVVKLQPEHRGSLRAERRLDGGRRERLRVTAPAVVSVEGGTARLRRAPLSGMLRGAREGIERLDPPASEPLPGYAHGRPRPYRPRARALDPPDPTLPARDRILRLTGALAERSARQLVQAEPAEAAEQLIAALRAWGYLE